VLFEQNIKGIIEGNSEKTMDGEVTNNCDEDARNIQMRIGIKDWYAPVS
jgi:hypothetical protein